VLVNKPFESFVYSSNKHNMKEKESVEKGLLSSPEIKQGG